MRTIIFISIALLMGVCTSCTETQESLLISIQNKTDSVMYIKLYPNAEYLTEYKGDYRFSDGGVSRKTEFSLAPNERQYDWDEVLFESSNLKIEPYTLTERVFDSIEICMENEGKIIRFTHDNVVGYSENIFSENSTWGYETVEWDVSTMKRKKAIYYWYRFVISEKNFVIICGGK